MGATAPPFGATVPPQGDTPDESSEDEPTPDESEEGAAPDTSSDSDAPGPGTDGDGERRPVPPLYLTGSTAPPPPSTARADTPPPPPAARTEAPGPPPDPPSAPPPPPTPAIPRGPAYPSVDPAQATPIPWRDPADAPAYHPPGPARGGDSPPDIPILVDPPSPFGVRQVGHEGPKTGPITPPGGTRGFGPRPPTQDEAPQPRRHRNYMWLMAACGVLAVVALVAAFLLLLLPGGDDGCPEVEEPLDEIGVQVLEGDPEGDGCNTYGVYRLGPLPDGTQGMTLTIRIDGERRRIPLGDFSDRMLLGDWDCDGIDTPALYRWAEGEEGAADAVGEVLYFNSWPETDDAEYEPDETEEADARGRAEVVQGDGESADSGECDRVAIRPLDTSREWTTFEPVDN